MLFTGETFPKLRVLPYSRTEQRMSNHFMFLDDLHSIQPLLLVHHDCCGCHFLEFFNELGELEIGKLHFLMPEISLNTNKVVIDRVS